MRTYSCKECGIEVELDKYPVKCQKCKKMMLKKDFLGILGEYLVTTELISRNLYAQVTFGNMKKMDILVNFQDEHQNEFFKIIEVKTKQDGNSFWFHGIPVVDKNRLVIFVDFKGKLFDERADFYILNTDDVRKNIVKQVEGYIKRMKNSTKKLTNIGSLFIKNHPDYDLDIDELPDQINFSLTKDSDKFLLAYFDLTSGSIFSQTKKHGFKPMGWDFDTTYMGEFKEKWNKIIT